MVDLLAVLCANLFNLFICGIMLTRVCGTPKWERLIGYLSVGLIIPLGAILIFNCLGYSTWWRIFLPGILILYLLIEWILDYVLRYDFRSTRWLGPYLLLFYGAQWGMIGYGFLVREAYGFATLITYFLSLAATAYSYRQVGHGNR